MFREYKRLKILLSLFLFFIILPIAWLTIWVRGGSQSSVDTKLKKMENLKYKTYNAVIPGNSLQLVHFISEPHEINVSSSLVIGQKEIIVFTAQATKYAAERLANEIEKTGRKLTYVLLDHAHADHSQGASVLKKRFPNAKFIAHPKVAALQKLRIEADDERAIKRYGDDAAVPSVPFESFDGDKLIIEGHEIQLWHNQIGDVGVGHANEPHTVVYIPAIKALLPNDICYFNGHMMMGGSTKVSRAKWKAQIRSYMDMDLQVVIPGHVPRKMSHGMTAKGVLSFSLQYIEDYERALKNSSSSDEVIRKMLKQYPDIGHPTALYLGTFINFREMHRLMFNPRIEKIASFLPPSFLKWINKKIFEAVTKKANN